MVFNVTLNNISRNDRVKFYRTKTLLALSFQGHQTHYSDSEPTSLLFLLLNAAVFGLTRQWQQFWLYRGGGG